MDGSCCCYWWSFSTVEYRDGQSEWEVDVNDHHHHRFAITRNCYHSALDGWMADWLAPPIQRLRCSQTPNLLTQHIVTWWCSECRIGSAHKIWDLPGGDTYWDGVGGEGETWNCLNSFQSRGTEGWIIVIKGWFVRTLKQFRPHSSPQRQSLRFIHQYVLLLIKVVSTEE